MLTENHLKNLLHKSEFANTDKLLMCLAVDASTSKSIASIKRLAITNGLRNVQKWNISQYLSKSRGRAIRVAKGWELSADGKIYIQGLTGSIILTTPRNVASSLRNHVSKVKKIEIREFVEEGIECFEQRLYRSAVVLSWVGAVALLYESVYSKHLVAFNAEAISRNSKWKPAKTTDDLSLMKEYDFLQIIEKISIIGKNVRQELEKQLKLRNACGHPNTLKIAEHVAASHLEILILNVFTKFT